MNRILLVALAIVVLAIGVVATGMLFIVHETEQALVVRLGEPRRVIQQPGLHMKLPFIENVLYFDDRVLDYAPPAEEIIPSDQKRVVVDTFARFRITSPLQFYQANQGSEAVARDRLRGILISSLRRVIGNRTLASLLSEERAEIMRQIREETNERAAALGIEVIDVRIRRADLPQANAEAIYQRMQSEREREAREFRAQGAELAQRIRSRAERERTVIIAEAQRQAQILRGEGDADATAIYADAFNRDPEFFAFYRSMEAYRNSLTSEGTTLVLTPDSDFFRYFGTTGLGLRETTTAPGEQTDRSGAAVTQPPDATTIAPAPVTGNAGNPAADR